MKKDIAYFLVFLLASVGCNSNESDAEKIITKHLKAIGGEQKIAEQETVYSKGEMESQFMGKGTIEMWAINKKGFRSDITVDSTILSSVIYDQYSWKTATPGKATPPIKMPDAAWASMDLDLSGEIADYLTKGNRIDYSGSDTIDGKPCHKIKLTNKAGKTTYYSIDKETYYILQSKVFHTVGGKEVDYGTSRFGDYRKTNTGVVLPYLLIQVMDGKVVGTTRLSTVEVNSVIDNIVFKKPQLRYFPQEP